MPKRKAAIVARANNLPNLAFTLAKKVIERLSPQKKAKRAVNIQPKITNEAPLTHHSDDNEDVFIDAGTFHIAPDIPCAASVTYYTEFRLPTPPEPRFPINTENDDISVLALQFDTNFTDLMSMSQPAETNFVMD
ncbi:hypothetical protein H0H92_015969, partial [Tricholoma furcatifolium]